MTMIPQYTQETFLQVENQYGESFVVPADIADLQESETVIATHSDKWFCRLSSPGYLDCTDWNGPFDTLAEAQTYIRDTFNANPVTGEDLDVDAANSLSHSALVEAAKNSEGLDD